MGDWARTTRECRYEQLAPDMRAAFEKYCALYNLGPLGAQSTLCIETTSKNVKKGLFGGAAKDVVVAALLAPGWLLWAIRGDSPQNTRNLDRKISGDASKAAVRRWFPSSTVTGSSSSSPISNTALSSSEARNL